MARPKAEVNMSLSEIVRTLSEKTRLQATRPNIHGYVPHPKQLMFHQHSAKDRLYIGGNRSGKTTGGIAEDIMWLRGRHPYRKTPLPPIRGRIVGPGINDGVEKILKPEFIRWMPISELRGGSWSSAYDSPTRTVHLQNGSFLEFMSYDQDLEKFAGTSRHFIHFDEEPPQDIYIECMARLIDTGGSWWMTLTPVEGMEWMYDEIYLAGKNDFSNSNIGVVEVDMHENPYLGREEIQSFTNRLNVDDANARVKGMFIRRGGLVYKNFDPQIHVIKPLKETPKHGELYASFDHGFNNPTAWYWHHVDSDGNVITFFEHYEAEQTVEYHSAKIHEINKSLGRLPDVYVGDPSIAQRNAVTGDSIQAQYALHDIFIGLGNNDVLAGINKISTYLSVNAKTKRPYWHITENCPNLIWEMQRYRWKTWQNKKIERANNKWDVAHKKDDHGCDSCRYFFTLMPDLTPIQIIQPTELPSMYALVGKVPEHNRLDHNLLKSKNTNSEWNIEYVDEVMGGEW